MQKEKLKKLIVPLIMLIAELFLFFQMVSSKPNITIKYKVMFLVICILSNLVAYVLVKVINKYKKIKLENIFLGIAISFGFLYLIFIPAILGTDELPHFLRPYQISVGDVIVKHPEKNETQIPKDLGSFVGEKDMSKRYSKERILKSVDYSDTESLWNGDVTSIRYSPVSYIPQVIGFWLSRLFGLSPLLTLFLVRFCNFSVWLAISYFAFKLLPIKKTFALLLYTAPSVLSIVSTCSYDALALSLMLLLIAYILNIIKYKKSITKKDFLILLLISLGISTYKVFYIIYILLLLIIPKECYKNKKQKITYTLLILILSFLLDFGWYAVSMASSVTGSSVITEQLKFILMHPIKYLFIFINTYVNDIFYYVTNVIAGSEMCYGLARINQLFVLIYLGLLISSYFVEKNNIELKKSSKFLIAFVCLAIFALVSTTLYLEWTANKSGIGASKIIGIQSRYFVCLIIPFILLLPKPKKILKNSKKIICFSILLNSLMFIDCIKSLLLNLFNV
ncbi:MAG TPA: DUF2142 domain-containing protein [Candidatus Aphodocola excrementigallinarum]|uniref:DUF2142 domain-containing protein n=1 Tax=Candidatus Aphodocola excrementigallinarum TaxID=2840670 RepID=A0A9D1LH77_9FIRM|nr:DUF2142 domain-containing protein [Candidatus Aphodocola excrementigallinarum]